MHRRLTDLLSVRSEEHERMILSYMATNRAIVPGVIPEYFCGANRTLFEALYRQFSSGGDIDPSQLPSGLSGPLSVALGTIANKSTHVLAALHEKYLWRSLASAFASAMSHDRPEEALRTAQIVAAHALLRNGVEKYEHTEALSRLFDKIDAAVVQEKAISGASVGINGFDEAIQGIEVGKFYVIGALKKTGKSRFMVHMAVELAQRGLGVLIESLEMSHIRLNLLALSKISGLNSTKITKMMSREEHQKLSDAASVHAKTNWIIYGDHDVAAIKARLVNERTTHPVDVVFVDFIQRLRDDTLLHRNRSHEVERISQELADLAREEEVAVIALSQLTGAAESVEMPNMSHYKESQAIVENADCIITLHNPERHENPFKPDGSYMVPTITCKVEQRDGLSGIEFGLRADLRTCQFSLEPDFAHAAASKY